jgi:hypothetical protein
LYVPVRTAFLLALAAATTACTAGSDEPPSVAFVSPAPGTAFTRDSLGENGALVAQVPVQLDIAGSPAKVTLTRDTTLLGDANDAGELTAQVRTQGAATLTATAYDDAGTVLATATVDITIDAPNAETCHDWLDLYQLDYMIGPEAPGIADPITVKAPVNGVAWRYTESTSQRKTLYADCELIKSLADAAPILRDHAVTEVADIGIYNYRCIDQSKTPPNCSMSQHAYARAIDLAAFLDTSNTTYTVLTDWDIDPATTTCTAETSDDKDAFLHTLICELKAANVWNIVLTPNYNADHRNHLHVDLTPDADTIKRDAPVDDYDMVVDDHATF